MAITIHETQLEAFAKLSPEEQVKVVEQIEAQHGPEVLAQYSALYNQWYANKQAEAEASGDEMGLGEYFGIAAGSQVLTSAMTEVGKQIGQEGIISSLSKIPEVAGQGLEKVTSGITGLFSSSAPEAAASAASNLPTSAAASGALQPPNILAANQIGGAGAPGAAAPGMGMASIVPALGVAGGAALLAKGAKDMWEGDSGTDSLEGLGGRTQLAITTGGLSELGRALGIGGHVSTKERQAKRENKLAGYDPTFEQFRGDSQSKEAEIKAQLARAMEATGDDHVGWWDDPETDRNEWQWVNKKINQDDLKSSNFQDIGSGDVMFHPWFFENVEGWGNAPWEARDAFTKAAIASGSARGNAGHIDFDFTDAMKAVADEHGLKIRDGVEILPGQAQPVAAPEPTAAPPTEALIEPTNQPAPEGLNLRNNSELASALSTPFGDKPNSGQLPPGFDMSQARPLIGFSNPEDEARWMEKLNDPSSWKKPGWQTLEFPNKLPEGVDLASVLSNWGVPR